MEGVSDWLPGVLVGLGGRVGAGVEVSAGGPSSGSVVRVAVGSSVKVASIMGSSVGVNGGAVGVSGAGAVVAVTSIGVTAGVGRFCRSQPHKAARARRTRDRATTRFIEE